MSAPVPRAIMPSNVLLPTPLPPKIPMRWPRPQVTKASRARMPQPSGSRMGTRSRGRGADPSTHTDRCARYSPFESRGAPVASITRPSKSLPTRIDDRVPQATIRSPKRMPCGFSTAMESMVDPRKPITSPEYFLPMALVISQDSPIEQKGPSDSIRLPTTCNTRPRQRRVDPRSRRSK